jgi:hypothetical protein
VETRDHLIVTCRHHKKFFFFTSQAIISLSCFSLRTVLGTGDKEQLATMAASLHTTWQFPCYVREESLKITSCKTFTLRLRKPDYQCNGFIQFQL